MPFDSKSAQKLAEKLINKTFVGFTKTLFFRLASNQMYDTDTGTVYTNNTDTSVIGILGPFNNEKDGVDDYVTGDVQFVAAKLSFTFTPKTGQSVLDVDNNEYAVINKFEDAANATYRLQLRQARKQ